MVNPIQPSHTMQNNFIPADAFPGQKTEKNKDIPREIVDRKQEIPSAREEIPREQVEKAAEKLNRLTGTLNKKLKFKVRKKSQGFIIVVIDQETSEELQELQPEQALDLFNSYSRMAGLRIDKRI